MSLPLARTQPVEKFFIEYKDMGERDDGQPCNDNEVLLEQFAEYTDDDSFFSSGETVIECNPQRLRIDPMRRRAITSVHNTLQLRALTSGRVPEDITWSKATRTSWLYQIHNRAIALQYSSFFVFPARWTPRIVVYNIMHHYVMELILFFIILGYAIFQASWARYTAARNYMHKPDFMIWADVFYTCLLGFEMMARMFASGFILHQRSFFRSPWHWLDTAVLVLMIMECTWWQPLWNFTAWRLIRAVKCLSYVPAPVRMKLLAKSLLRSTNKLTQVTILLLYFIFFFGLLGLQLFVGSLHNRCVNDLTGATTSQVCRVTSTGKYWFYWGRQCDAGYTCVQDAFPNPYYDFRSFDDIGHAMLSVFQIMTFQDWTGLMIETNDGVAVMAFLYYAFTILICTWIIPSLYLGVFIEKIEKTSRLFVLKQLDFFDRMLTEQRQRMSTMVRLHDYVERDKEGNVTHYPVYTKRKLDDKRLTDDDTTSTSHDSQNVWQKKKTQNHYPRSRAHHRSIQSTKWTDEQRIQLHLSLTRQRHVAEAAEEKKQLQQAALGDLIMAEKGGRRGARGTVQVSQSNMASVEETKKAKGPVNFALGGRVGSVQHHPATCTIGASHQTDMPFAVRQEVQAEQLRFLDPYTNNARNAKNDIYNSAAAVDAGAGDVEDAQALRGSQTSRMASSARPPLGATNAMSVVTVKEAAGIVPNRRSMSFRGSLSRQLSHRDSGSISRLHASMTQQPQPEVELVINDPEGGDFEYATTFMQNVNIMRNIAHMFTEGYPRIITQYLWEHRMMQYRYGLMPLSYTNKYEEEALRRLRQRRAVERQAEREEMRRNGMAHLIDDESDEDGNVSGEKRWMREEGLIPGSMSPIRMARNISENAPITVFNYLMYFFIIANAVFNASRFSTMPDYWETGTFVAGVCFSALFMLELLIRLFALGPGPFFTDIFIMIETVFMVISLFQLGFSRANTTSLFNWVRFLRLFRVIPCRPLRRVTRVLIHSFPDMVYALILFTIYMFMWLLLGMSFFGSRMGWIDYSTSEYTTSGSFETFSHASYAIAQAFSVNRDQWLYLSWSGMRVRGGYTIMYFIATAGIALIFRYFLIAVMTYAWQSQQEQEDFGFMSGSSRGARHRGGRRSTRLPWFDFSVWRSFKHIHGGFDRRDVAPDEVYYLNEDMTRQLRLVAAKDRYFREQYGGYADGMGPMGMENSHDMSYDAGVHEGPIYVNIGGRLYRQPSLPATEMGPTDVGIAHQRGQLRFARQYRAVPAVAYATDVVEVGENGSEFPEDVMEPPPHDTTALSRQSRPMVNPLLSHRHSLSPGRQRGTGGSSVSPSMGRVADSLVMERASNLNISLVPHLNRLGNARALATSEAENASPQGMDTTMDDEVDTAYEHLLLPGPRLRYKSTMESGRRVFEVCLDCNTHMQMPLRAPFGVAQRTATELHAEHCHMSAVRSSQQLVLNALLGYARMQADHEVTPTKRAVEIVLGQAWSCGMLLFETIENLSCVDLIESERNWDRMLEALELQQWLLGLHVGEEQVGRATLAYILAHQKKEEAKVKEQKYTESWDEYTFFAISPSNPVRRTISRLVDAWWFEAIILAVIYAASICLAVYTPDSGDRDLGGNYNSSKYKALHVLDDIFTIIFVVEMVLKWISMGVVLPVGRAYFWHLWNIFDCFIVLVSLVSWGMDDVFLRYLKVMRCFRILGPLRYWRWGSTSMSTVARALWDSIPTLANVCLLMLMNYIVWAILFVSMFMNKMSYCSNTSIVNSTECEEEGFTWAPVQRNFQNFYESLLTTVEISTGAEWMDVMYSAASSWSTTFSPIQNRHPYLGLVFIAYYYISHFVLFTLFISALIYCYMLAKSATEEAVGLTVEHQLWIRLQGMIMRVKPKVRMLPANNTVSRLLHRLICNTWFEACMALILVFNMIIMALEWYDMDSKQETALNVLQWIFVAMFTVEVILRLAAHGLRFFTRWAYCWDLFVVVLSYLQIGLNTTHDNKVPFNVNVLRMLRVGRVLHLVNLAVPFSTHFSLFVEVVKAAVPGLISVTFIYMIAVYVFAILGLHFLGYIVPYGGYINDTYNNFATFVNALIMVFRLSTLEDWATMLRGSMERGVYCTRESGRCGPTNWAPVYYIPIVICFFLMLSSMFMAVVLDKYVAAIRMHSAVSRLRDLRHFADIWSRYDPNGTLWLPSEQLPLILEELRLPLGVSSRHNRVEMLRILREYSITDHDGRVYYYEVLMPLARRVMAVAFNEAEDVYITGGQSPNDIAWRLSERSLGAIPASYRGVKPGATSLVEHLAASYIQAAYRRDRATRNLYIMKSELWQQGRAVCEKKGLPYSSFGFGAVPLDGPDPRAEGIRRGFNIPKGTTMANSKDCPVYADPVAARIAAMRETAGKKVQEPSTLLPAVYRSAITANEKRFGPDVPGAIRRYERRSEKLERRRAQEAYERHLYHGDGVAFVEDEASMAEDGGDVPQRIGSAPVRRTATDPLTSTNYNMDPNDMNYQPPLGTSPETLRTEEIERRRHAAAAAASASALFGGVSPTNSPSRSPQRH